MQGRLIRRFALGALALATGWVMPVAAATEVRAQEPPTATVRVVHGLRGLVADVYLDGALALPTFQPERSTDPLTIPAGDHLIEIRTAGAPMTETPALTQTITAPAGFVGSVVAHLDRAGAPTLTVFADDLSPVPAGQTRLVVRHAAAAGPIDVLVDDRAHVAALNPQAESMPTVTPGEHRLTFASYGPGEAVGTPRVVSFAEGSAKFVYFIGSEAEGTLGWAQVEVTGLQTAPAQINTGDGSTRGDGAGEGGGLPLLPLGVALALVVVAGGLGTVRATRRST